MNKIKITLEITLTEDIDDKPFYPNLYDIQLAVKNSNELFEEVTTSQWDYVDDND